MTRNMHELPFKTKVKLTVAAIATGAGAMFGLSGCSPQEIARQAASQAADQVGATAAAQAGTANARFTTAQVAQAQTDDARFANFQATVDARTAATPLPPTAKPVKLNTPLANSVEETPQPDEVVQDAQSEKTYTLNGKQYRIDEKGDLMEIVEQKAEFGKFSISGAPKTVEQGAFTIWASREKTPGVEHVNTIGHGTEGWIGEWGVFNTHDPKEPSIKTGSAYLIGPANQDVLEDNREQTLPLHEGAFTEVYAAGMTLKLQRQGQPVTLVLNEAPGHVWYVILKDVPRDHKPDIDLNVPVKISDFNPGFLQYAMLPPGPVVSQNHVLQIVESGHGTYDQEHSNNCGASGCTNVSILMYDQLTGGWAVIRQSATDGLWQSGGTNIKGVK